jgi:hypothetical protein
VEELELLAEAASGLGGVAGAISGMAGVGKTAFALVPAFAQE